MKITPEWLRDHGACSEGASWFNGQGIIEPITGVKNLIRHDKLDWANWLIVRLMSPAEKIKYAVYAAKQMLYLFERKYPKDLRPRQAIKAALKYFKAPSEENCNAAYAADAAYVANAANAAYAAAGAAHAANAAYAAHAANAANAAANVANAAYAADAAYVAYAANAAYAAADAAYAANAAYAAANAANAAAHAAYAANAADAAYAAYAAANVADAAMKRKILLYGLRLLKKGSLR